MGNSENIEFKKEKISREILTKILDAGRFAPTAKNLQPQKIYVVESEEKLKKISESSKYFYNAPTVLIVCSDIRVAYIRNNRTSYNADSILTTMYMILEATHLGIDNIWIKDFDDEKIKKDFKLDENIIPVSLILLGYKSDDTKGLKATDFNNVLLPNQRKELYEIVTYV